MSISGSQNPDRLTTDPAPWRYALIEGSTAREATQVTAGFRCDPRPEYQLTTVHEANPILVEFRRQWRAAYFRSGKEAVLGAWAEAIVDFDGRQPNAAKNARYLEAYKAVVETWDGCLRPGPEGWSGRRAQWDRIRAFHDHAEAVLTRAAKLAMPETQAA